MNNYSAQLDRLSTEMRTWTF